METAEDIFALPERLAQPLDQGQWAFRLALLVALLCHAALFIEVGRSLPRTIGDRSGSPDAISVELVTAADLKSRETVALPPAGAPAPPPVPPAPQVHPQPPPQPQAEAPAPPQPKAAEPAPAPPQPKPAPAEAPRSEPVAKSVPPLPALADVPLPAPEAAETPPAPKLETRPEVEAAPERSAETPQPPKPQQPPLAARKSPPAQKQARLEPSPRELDRAPPGRSAETTRPPGITRSGENDAFGREVVRALRATMPPPRGLYGHVTVRLLLTANGDLAEVRVIDPSGTRLDQEVVFATKQTYFPLPPHKSTVLDRTFVIRYVYR